MSVDEAIARGRLRRELPDPGLRRLLRVRAGLTLLDVAQALETTTTAVSRWERGLRDPRGMLRIEYAKLLSRLEREVLRL